MPKLLFLEPVKGGHHEVAGRFLVSYDPDYHLPDGSYDGGKLITTADREKATEFPTVAEAMRVWRSGPSCPCHKTRPDGKPNRPLTAFTVEVV